MRPNTKEKPADLMVSRPQLLVKGGDDDFRRFVHDTMAFAIRMQAMRKALGHTIGLSGTQYTILLSIARHRTRGDVGINFLSERLHSSPAFITLEVNKLVAAGLVSKTENPEDRRRVQLAITPRAREILRNLTAIQRPANDILFESLSSEDFHLLRHKMLQLVNSADRALQLIAFLSGEAQIDPQEE